MSPHTGYRWMVWRSWAVFVPLVLSVGLMARLLHGNRQTEPDHLALRQPGSPWADQPDKYELPDDFERLAHRPAPRDHFKVLDYPPFVTADQADDKKLVDDQLPVLGVTHNSVAKAYPIQVLGIHELCNDAIADEPITASY